MGGTEKVASLSFCELSKSHNVEVVALQNKCEYLKLHKDVALHVLLPSEIEKVRFKYLKLLVILLQVFLKKGCSSNPFDSNGRIAYFLGCCDHAFF